MLTMMPFPLRVPIRSRGKVSLLIGINGKNAVCIKKILTGKRPFPFALM